MRASRPPYLQPSAESVTIPFASCEWCEQPRTAIDTTRAATTELGDTRRLGSQDRTESPKHDVPKGSVDGALKRFTQKRRARTDELPLESAPVMLRDVVRIAQNVSIPPFQNVGWTTYFSRDAGDTANRYRCSQANDLRSKGHSVDRVVE